MLTTSTYRNRTQHKKLEVYHDGPCAESGYLITEDEEAMGREGMALTVPEINNLLQFWHAFGDVVDYVPS